jgi:transposase
MLVLETVAKIRRAYLVQKKTIKAICRELRVSRKVVRKVLRSDATAFHYERGERPLPRIGPWQDTLDQMLASNEAKPGRERLTLIRIFEALRGLGYEGGYDAVRRYARIWQRDRAATSVGAFVPLSFAPGEAYQFDWSHEVVLINGTTVTVKVAHVRLCHSRMLFVRAYPRETQEMVFDAHDRAFAFFKGTCVRGIYANMKTAVETIFVGRERSYNRRFLQMCSHYLVDPVACNPASGWEKGQVENQVGLVRERFFTPRLRFKSYDELNAWLLDQCVSPMPRRTVTPNGVSRRSGRCSRRNVPVWSHMPDASTVSTACLHRSRRPVWCSSTRTNTRSQHRRLAALSRSAPMPIGSNCVRTGGSSAITLVASGATRRCSIPGITCRFWLVSRVR